MEKFKAKHPSNADFEEKLAKYAKLADDVWRQVRLSACFNSQHQHAGPRLLQMQIHCCIRCYMCQAKLGCKCTRTSDNGT